MKVGDLVQQSPVGSGKITDFTACEPEAPTCVSKFALCRE